MAGSPHHAANRRFNTRLVRCYQLWSKLIGWDDNPKRDVFRHDWFCRDPLVAKVFNKGESLMEQASITLLWLLPLLGISIWLQRGASFLIPRKHLDQPFLRSLNRWAPMAVILTLIYVSLDTGLISGWRGVAMEIAILTVFGLFYVITRQVLLTVLLAAATHWGFAVWILPAWLAASS